MIRGRLRTSSTVPFAMAVFPASSTFLETPRPAVKLSSRTKEGTDLGSGLIIFPDRSTTGEAMHAAIGEQRRRVGEPGGLEAAGVLPFKGSSSARLHGHKPGQKRDRHEHN